MGALRYGVATGIEDYSSADAVIPAAVTTGGLALVFYVFLVWSMPSADTVAVSARLVNGDAPLLTRRWRQYRAAQEGSLRLTRHLTPGAPRLSRGRSIDLLLVASVEAPREAQPRDAFFVDPSIVIYRVQVEGAELEVAVRSKDAPLLGFPE